MLGGEEEACVAIKGRTHSLRDGTVVGLNSSGDTNLHEIKGHKGDAHSSKDSCSAQCWNGGHPASVLWPQKVLEAG